LKSIIFPPQLLTPYAVILCSIASQAGSRKVCDSTGAQG
jgi:hypothetical protein